MKKKTLLPQITAPVERSLITSVSPHSSSQAVVNPAIHWPGFAVSDVPFAANGDE